ncbi:hypothetical protein [Vibrio sp. D431a]|uniref:hypothetical protein n=1 Tax=Vibrio sp. D431a TaxID=2837388 RepID=UPI002553A6AD|nr:hypothetical protein [Vibrio sp. D431a]MDK9790178.1 hypothetical protein [Vibrio sp. D431a]
MKNIPNDVVNELNLEIEEAAVKELFNFLSKRSKIGSRFKSYRLFPFIQARLNNEEESLRYDSFVRICSILEDKGYFRRAFFLEKSKDSYVEIELTEEQVDMLNNKVSFNYLHNNNEYLSWESISLQYVLTKNFDL